jgi:DNA replication protein DnaC
VIAGTPLRAAEVLADILQQGDEIQRRYAESPHRCGGCGSHLLKPGHCFACLDRIEAERQSERDRKRRVAATVEALWPRFRWAHTLSAPELDSRVDAEGLATLRSLDLASVDRVTAIGPAGKGKTSGLCAIACDWSAQHGRKVTFAAAADLGVSRLQTSLGEGEANLVARALAAPLLVLDDVGAEAALGTPTIEHVLRSRYDQMLPTLTSTGLDVAQLLQRYGSGVGRRLLESSGGAVVIRFGRAGK